MPAASICQISPNISNHSVLPQTGWVVQQYSAAATHSTQKSQKCRSWLFSSSLSIWYNYSRSKWQRMATWKASSMAFTILYSIDVSIQWMTPISSLFLPSNWWLLTNEMLSTSKLSLLLEMTKTNQFWLSRSKMAPIMPFPVLATPLVHKSIPDLMSFLYSALFYTYIPLAF